MNAFCQDRDLLAIEPVIFFGGPAGQQLAAGTDGELDGTAFTSDTADFVAAGAAGGMVLYVYASAPEEGSAYEIVSVDSAAALTVSVLRGDPQTAPVAPPAGSKLSFHVRTYQPQIQSVSATLAEKLRQIAEVAGLAPAKFADSRQLRTAAAHGALASIFVARAHGARPIDANWIKAEHYRSLFRELQLQLRLAVDADGDGQAERTRTLGNVAMRRV